MYTSHATPSTPGHIVNKFRYSASILLIVLLAALQSLPTLPITVLVVLYLGVLDAVGVTLLAGVLRHHAPGHG